MLHFIICTLSTIFNCMKHFYQLFHFINSEKETRNNLNIDINAYIYLLSALLNIKWCLNQSITFIITIVMMESINCLMYALIMYHIIYSECRWIALISTKTELTVLYVLLLACIPYFRVCMPHLSCVSSECTRTINITTKH